MACSVRNNGARVVLFSNPYSQLPAHEDRRLPRWEIARAVSSGGHTRTDTCAHPAGEGWCHLNDQGSGVCQTPCSLPLSVCTRHPFWEGAAQPTGAVGVWGGGRSGPHRPLDEYQEGRVCLCITRPLRAGAPPGDITHGRGCPNTRSWRRPLPTPPPPQPLDSHTSGTATANGWVTGGLGQTHGFAVGVCAPRGVGSSSAARRATGWRASGV